MYFKPTANSSFLGGRGVSWNPNKFVFHAICMHYRKQNDLDGFCVTSFWERESSDDTKEKM